MTRSGTTAVLAGFVRGATIGMCLVACLSSTLNVWAAPTQFPRFSEVQSTVQGHFAQMKDRGDGDLICRADVEPIFAQLEQVGWAVSDKTEILSEMLDGNDFLVRTLRSRDGLRFMREVSNYKLIYDRLDRIAHESGGQRLIRDLIKLPDAARYAKLNPGRGVPGMLEFLPKNRSGKSRQVADYKKPTRKVYTLDQFLQRLLQSYAEDSRQVTQR